MSGRRPLIAGNWKMHLTHQEAVDLVSGIREGTRGIEGLDVLVAPPFTSLGVVKTAIGDSPILLAAQNMHWEKQGAFTGEVSPAMLLDAGCTHVILGHSERRSLFAETSDMVDRKTSAAFINGLVPIVCVGETLQERESGKTVDIIRGQLDASLRGAVQKGALSHTTVLAYEPVWAIGTGKTASPEQAQEVHHFIRGWLEGNFDGETAQRIRILYGGSVKPENAGDLMSLADIDGALIGGASLKVESFVSIIRSSGD